MPKPERGGRQGAGSDGGEYRVLEPDLVNRMDEVEDVVEVRRGAEQGVEQERIGAGAAVQAVMAIAAVDLVVAGTAVDHVVAIEAPEDVGSTIAGEGVGRRCCRCRRSPR